MGQLPSYQLTRNNGRWQINARTGSESATGGALLVLGSCPSQVVALRLWLSLLVNGAIE